MSTLNTFVIVVVVATITYLNATMYTCERNLGCGCSKYDTTVVNARIVNGETAAVGAWGWVASLKLGSKNPHICGGTVIDEYHILTAAHCIADLAEYGFTIYDIEVRVGLNVISNPGPNVESHSLQGAKIHPAYDKDDIAGGHDIAILTLSRPIDFNRNSFISKVCLPFLNSTPPADLANPEYPLPNTDLIAIGWGVLWESSDVISNTLQQVTLQAIDKDDSKCRFPANPPIPAQNNDPQTQMCASAPSKDSCQGDSGGPLLMFRPDTKVWELVGITSFGIGCARPSYSGVYTRVAAYHDWIKQNTPPTPTPAVPTPSTTPTPAVPTPSTTPTPAVSTPSTTPDYNGAQREGIYGGLLMTIMSIFLCFSV